ncbi:glycosyltransferase family 2 protein [Lacrimispora sp.]|uniref:glycosyltransferase family 2 protein n=1 Tax=Lacrimispora sp. TaxID=2719234 RepID=UPI00345F7705
MKKLNLVMIVKNEERCLARCLKSVKDLVDDMIIVDTGSEDATKQIAVSFGAKIYDYAWKNDFSDARNFALSKSDSDWNLILDADEYLVQGRRSDISKLLDRVDLLGAIQIKNAYMDNGELSYGIDYTTRIIPKGIYYYGKIHEQVDSGLSRIPVPLIFEHDGYLMPNKPERNLPILLEELNNNPNDSYFLYQVASTLVNMNRHKEAMTYFEDFYNSVRKSDNFYRKGLIKYIYALIEIENFEKALKIVDEVNPDLQKYADFNFLCGIFYVKLILSDIVKYQNYLPLIEKSYLKCIEIGEVPQHQGVYGCGSFKAAYNLGAWYEAAGNLDMAKKYYELSACPAVSSIESLL